MGKGFVVTDVGDDDISLCHFGHLSSLNQQMLQGIYIRIELGREFNKLEMDS